MSFKGYPEYKEIALEWLDKIPCHWELKRNKYFLKERNDRSTHGDEELLTVSHYTGITKRKDRFSDDNSLLTNASSLIGYKRVFLMI
jgi:type I restriction enzyme S subunit